MVAKSDISKRGFGLLNRRNNENFTYDNLNRLTAYGNNSLTYRSSGNITFKTDAGTLTYGNSNRPFQVTGQANFASMMDPDPRTITYTSDNSPATIEKSGNTAEFSYNHAGERTKMIMSGASNYTRIYLGGNYECEIIGNDTVKHLYLGGTPYNAPAVAIKTNNGDWDLRYIHRDYLGSIVAVSNDVGAAVETNSYDAWGNRTLVSGSRILQRGYTGHEHLPEFGLINMNARLYDPVLGRMLSPDPYVQAPDFSQSFNRYSYCLNNPLIYTDPTGEKWWKKPWVWALADILTGGAVSISASTTFISASVTANTFASTAVPTELLVSWFKGFDDPTAAAQRVQNTFKLVGGLFKTDENANFGERAWQLISRHTWENIQTFGGLGYSSTRNMLGHVSRVDYLGGNTWVTRENDSKDQAFAFGNYVNVSISDEIGDSFTDYVLDNPWLMHELGHTVDSRVWGPLYLFAVGIPSVISFNNDDPISGDPYGRSTHDVHWAEMRANRHAAKYFGKYYGVDWDYLNLTNDRFWRLPLRYHPNRTTVPGPVRRRR